MSFLVGLLYSAHEFVAYINTNRGIHTDAFKKAFNKFSLAKSEDVLNLSLKCNWIDLYSDGICCITQQGRILLEQNNLERVLRLQIRDLIHVEEPPWATKIPHGRQEAQKAFPDEVNQCFKEAGLLREWDDDVIHWWDELSITTRSHKSKNLLITGRTAEKFTMQYEKDRVGIMPHWQSIESNFSGYDILSLVSKVDDTPRKIEVKGTSLSIKEAYFVVTNNEWRTAELAKDYRFHLWCLKGKEKMRDVSSDEIRKHIPKNQAEGKWETVRIPFQAFF